MDDLFRKGDKQTLNQEIFFPSGYIVQKCSIKIWKDFFFYKRQTKG